jgi:hypothetical protein
MASELEPRDDHDPTQCHLARGRRWWLPRLDTLNHLTCAIEHEWQAEI